MASSSFPEKEVKGDSPNWLELPTDITFNILQRLDTVEIVTSACQVCPLWWNICKDPLMWRTVHMTTHYNSPYNLEKIFRYAIQRSCGQLEDIDIHCFATDDLLKCIAKNASHLRCMRLADCRGISDEGFIEVAKMFPLLEELDISFSESLSKDSLEVIGRSCPLLKSLIYSRCFYSTCDDEAIAVGKTMTKLRHLKIYGNLLTNDGLLAILDGCPLLESLDLSGCLNFNLSEPLVKRCHKKIKDLSFPFNYIDYYFYDDGSYLDNEENYHVEDC